MSERSPKREGLSIAAMNLMMAANWQATLALAHEGPNSIGKRSLQSPQLMLAFLTKHPAIAYEFLGLAQVEEEVFRARLEAEHDMEPVPDPIQLPENPTDEQRDTFKIMRELEEDRVKRGDAPSFSKPIKEALRLAKRRAKEAGIQASVGGLVAALLETESIARNLFEDLTTPAVRQSALEWLSAQADPQEQLMPASMGDTRELLDRMWPKIQEESKARVKPRIGVLKDEHYEKDPSQYEEPIDVAARLRSHKLGPENDYSWRSGVCLHAAENEARMRRAPDITLDHLLLALLRDGTDTAEFLEERGVDRARWTEHIDRELPRFSEGPRWPQNARSLGMSIPTNRSGSLNLPEGVRFIDLAEGEGKQYLTVEIDEKLFTDLAFLVNVPDEPKTIGHGLFLEAGITKDALMARVKGLEKGDANWWRSPLNLVDELASVKRDGFTPGLDRWRVYELAALFEARKRWSPAIELDDLLIALLVPGTDLWRWLTEHDVSAEAIRGEILVALPVFQTGPFFPGFEDPELQLLGAILDPIQSDLQFLNRAYRIFENEAQGASFGLRRIADAGLTQEEVRKWLAERGFVDRLDKFRTSKEEGSDERG